MSQEAAFYYHCMGGKRSGKCCLRMQGKVIHGCSAVEKKGRC